jgi:hypothetical protein
MNAALLDRYDDDESSPHLIERRWSAAVAAAKTLQGECAVLREVIELAEQAWRDAHSRLAAVQALRDELAKCLCDPEPLSEHGAAHFSDERGKSANESRTRLASST